MLQHGFGGNGGQNLTGEASRLKSGRNYAENFTRHTRSYHETRVLDSGKKGKPSMMLPSCRKLLIYCATVLLLPGAFWGQASLETRPKPGVKPEPRPQANIRIDSTLVLISVTVTDPLNRFVTGLEKESFKLFEDKKEQEISQFSSEDAPLSIGVVFDCSGSMGKKLQKSRQAVAQFFKTANPEDEFFLIQFSDGADMIQGFTKNLEEIQNRLMFTQPKGRTALLDALY